MSRPITPTSPLQSEIHGQNDPSLHSARPLSTRAASRPVSYVGGHPTDASSHIDHTHAATHDTSMMSHVDDYPEEARSHREASPDLTRTNSYVSGSQTLLPSRGGTLKKKASLHKSASLKRTPSKRSSYAGSVRSMKLGEKERYGESDEYNSVFYCPVPTSGNPTELLASRFQGKQVLVDSRQLVHRG